jgi:hypothetical protein
MVRSSCLFLLLIAAACGSNSSLSGPCESNPPNAACSLDCNAQAGAPNTCPTGYHCETDGKCFAQCTITGGQCGDGNVCTDDGHCAPKGDPGTGTDPNCPAVAFTAKPTTPSILLLLDKSGSMGRDKIDGVLRWDAVRNALVDPASGVVSQLAPKAFFGALIYDTGGGTCPRLQAVPRALNNAAVIRAAMAGVPNDKASTPTAKSIDAAVASFATMAPPTGSPPIILLATDGIPYKCVGNQVDDKVGTVDAAKAAFAAGIRLIPLSVGNDVGDQHLQDVANAGSGVLPGQPNAPLYKANTVAALKAAFDSIIGGVVSCDLTVNGSIDQTQAAGGDVRLNGRSLTFNTDWQLIGDHTIRLLGAACTELKTAANPVVNGTFPCGVVIE